MGAFMKRKTILSLLITVCILYFASCGKQETTATTESVPATVESAQAETTVPEETIATETNAETVEDTITDTSASDTTSQYLSESDEICHSKWADINGAWDAEHQYTLYAQENGADYTFGWTWCYDHGKGAGDQPSYAVYMKEGDPLYGSVYHVGDYLPDGTQFSGTNDEWEAFIKQDFRDRVEADGYDVYDDPDGDGFIIDLDGSYNPNNNTTSQPAQSSEEQTVTGPTGDGSGSSRENRGNAGVNSGTVGGGNLQ